MQQLQKRLGYQFKNADLLKLALIHPSINKQQSNQRLEFLGDAVLGAVVAKIIYTLYPDEQEGELARRHSALVRGETLTIIARELAIGDLLTFGVSEIQAGGHNTASNLEDALEAIIGAIYLDGGMDAVEQFITPRWTALAKKITAPPKDAKTALQEWAQGRGLPIPSYRMLESTGPAHAPLFTIEVTVQGQPPCSAQGASKRTAEQAAATELLQKLSE